MSAASEIQHSESTNPSVVLTDVTFGNINRSMPTLTLKVPIQTAARLGRLAAQLRTSKSEVLRKALERALHESSSEPSLYDLMKSSIGTIDSGIQDLGHNPKHLAGFGRK